MFASSSHGGHAGRLMFWSFVLLVWQSDQSLELPNLLRRQAVEICRLRCYNLRDIWWFVNVLRESGCAETAASSRPEYQKITFGFDLTEGMTLAAEMTGERTFKHRLWLESSSNTFPYHFGIHWDADYVLFNSKYNNSWGLGQLLQPIPISNNYTITIRILHNTFETYGDDWLMMSLPRKGPLEGTRTVRLSYKLALCRFDVIF